MIEEIKNVLIRGGIFTTEEIKEIAEEIKNGKRIEAAILERKKITKTELEKIIFNILYLEKKDIFKIIEENIKDNKKRELFYKKISNKELNEKEKIEELLTEGVIIEEELTFAKSVY